jgi:NAD(P)-dependent dehydrogenase (short-subunit alcohol dehydrogenase family)
MPGTTVYGATKAAVINLAKTLSAELLERGIRVNAVSPGPITAALLRDGPQEKIQETKDWIQSQVPIKRFGTPEEIAAGVLYLTSPESAFGWAPNSSLTAVWRPYSVDDSCRD